MQPEEQNDGDSVRVQKQQQHRCTQCEASFTRLEHLKRHRTMHTNIKAFACVFCFKDFARSDVLHRHYLSCKLARQADAMPIAANRRVNRACLPCRQSKVKCSGLQPCERCNNMGQGRLCRFTLRKLRLAEAGQVNVDSNKPSSSQEGQVTAAEDAYTHQPAQEAATRLVSPPASISNHQTDTHMSDSQALPAGYQAWKNTSDASRFEVTSDQASPSAGQLHSTTTTSAADSGNDTVSASEFALSPSIFFDLDLADYGIIDSSLMMLDYHGQAGSATSVSADDISESPKASPLRPDGPQDEEAYLLPKGIQLMQVSPLHAHRARLLRHLKDSSLGHGCWDRWLSPDNMTRYISSYLNFFHRHTPFLHLPSWNIANTSPGLLFSMILMGAVYSGDLDVKSTTDRRFCKLVQSFAWDSDEGLQAGSPARLDTIQAAYIAILVEVFYFPTKSHRPPADTGRLVDEARRAGILSPGRAAYDPRELRWKEWSIQESRKRTAFVLYLFDAIQAVVFEQQPRIHLDDVRMPLPCDEKLYCAETEEEWQGLHLEAQDLTNVAYPVLLALFLCHRPLEMTLNFSVMGGFIVLHGVLLHIAEYQALRRRQADIEGLSEAEKNVRDHLAVTQAQIADNALQLWLKRWNETLSRPASMGCQGLYRDRALVYWLLGDILNQHQSAWRGPNMNPSTLANSQWKTKIPRLLRQITIVVDSAKQDGKNGTVDPDLRDRLASYIGASEGGINADAPEEDMDTLTINYLMRKESR